jgi:hypothetical protein
LLFIFAAPIVILGLVLAVPIAYRYLWPIKIRRPKLFLVITLTMGLVVAGVAIFWFFSVLMGIGITGASPRAAAPNAAFEFVLRNRLLVAAVFAALIEYLLCRITQTIMDA